MPSSWGGVAWRLVLRTIEWIDLVLLKYVGGKNSTVGTSVQCWRPTHSTSPLVVSHEFSLLSEQQRDRLFSKSCVFQPERKLANGKIGEMTTVNSS